jgi:hypothetical protein
MSTSYWLTEEDRKKSAKGSEEKDLGNKKALCES